MKYIIKQIDSDANVSYYNGSEFQASMEGVHISNSITDARYLQGTFQSRFVNSEISKVTVSTSVTVA